MEFVSFLGICFGIAAVFGGAVLEGLHLSAILQLTAGVIVLGGTLGATLLSFPQQDVRRAISLIQLVFKKVKDDPREIIDEIVEIANISRREGVLAIESIRDQIKNELFKKYIKFVIDGFELQTVREIMETEISQQQEAEENAARVWEGAGGYAPTIGIIGAVLGLIHVMKGLKDPGKDIGSGIAVAFVATVYGVASANLIFIPFGTKIKRKAQMNAFLKEVVMMGVIGIQEGLNPIFLKEKMEIYVTDKSPSIKKKKGKK